MNATPASDGRPHTHERAAHGTQTPLVPGAESVPRQKEGARESERLRGVTADLLEHPDPHTAAQAAAVENLLRCWVRENNLARPRRTAPSASPSRPAARPCSPPSTTGPPPAGTASASRTSPTLPMRHRPADAVTVAALLARQAATGTRTADRPCNRQGRDACQARHGSSPTGRRLHGSGARRQPCLPRQPRPPDHLAKRERPAPKRGFRTAPPVTAPILSAVSPTPFGVPPCSSATAGNTPPTSPDLFLTAEQALLLGHPLHPTPKSREGLSEAEARLYSPELRGSFPLHWMAVAPSVLAADSAWTERGRPVPADQLTARLAGAGLSLPDGYAALPLHPWQMREIRHRPETAALLDAGTAPGPRPAWLRLAPHLLRPHPLPLRRPRDAEAVAGPAHHQLPS